jgi:NitT/TauT family transport system ATP-binding protein
MAAATTAFTPVPLPGTGVGAAHPQPRQTSARLAGVGKRFTPNGPTVLEDITLSLRPGEFVSLIGASGCGKSTLLSIVAGLEAPSTGRVHVTAPGAALMFQDPALFPWLTARENVELALRLAGTPRNQRRARADELLDLVRLDGAGDKRVHELSGGMRQRVALARSLAQKRQLLLMDEPFASLDAITRDLMHDELERIWRETGWTVLFVTHNVREAVRLGQRVVLLSSRPGRIVREWAVDVSGARRIESPEVAALAVDITEHLREEIRRHGR